MARRADFKTGTDCNSNCVFCVIGDQLFTGDRSTEECVADLRASRATCEDVVFTGAEVTIRPDFFQLVETARRLRYRTIQIQTNGRMFAYREFCEPPSPPAPTSSRRRSTATWRVSTTG